MMRANRDRDCTFRFSNRRLDAGPMGDVMNDWDEFEDDEFDESDPADDCGLMHDGQCMYAGSEWCDFECPFRDSPDFAGNDPEPFL